MEPGTQDSLIERPDGAQLRVIQMGQPLAEGGLAILILDGIGCSGWAFERILPTLAAEFPVIFVHHRGHGGAPTPPRPWALDMAVLADDAAAIVTQLGAGRVVAVGFSMGFQVALELCRRHPTLVAGLVSIAGAGGRVLDNFLRTKAFSFVLPVLTLSARVAGEWTQKVWKTLTRSTLAHEIALRFQVNADVLNPADLDLYARQISQVDPELFIELLAAAHRHDAADLFPRIDVPTRVLAGARDSFVPLETQRAMAFAIPDVQWRVFPEATHALPAEFPERVSAELLDLVREVAGRKALASAT